MGVASSHVTILCVLSSVRISLLWLQPVRAPRPRSEAPLHHRSRAHTRPATAGSQLSTRARNLRTRSFGCGHAASRAERHGGSVSRSSAPQRRSAARLAAASPLRSAPHSAGRGVRQPGGVPSFFRPLAAELRRSSPEVGSSPSASSSPPSWSRARGSSGTCCPSACWPRCSTCRRLARPTPRRAESAEAKGRTAQVGPPLSPSAPSGRGKQA